jgi:peptide/nickel transport system substrate-binding protein
MTIERGISRRALLKTGMSLAGVGLLAACGPSAPATKPADTKPADAAKPAAAAPTTAPAAGAATQPPAAAAQTQASPAAAATTAPAAGAAAKPSADNKPAAALGSNLIGKLEGPTIVTDPAQMPKAFKEAPMLADMVKAGKLPPVEQRLPSEPMVLKPLRAIGQYGGTWRRSFTGPADGEHGNRMMATDKLIFVDYTGIAKIVPSLAKGWEIADGGKRLRIMLRKGTKWSDGEPFTADDIMFWFTDLYSNKDIIPSTVAEFTINGKPGVVTKVDDVTVDVTFPDPYPMFLDVMSAFTIVGAGFSLGSTGNGPFQGFYAPAHYLKPFHPTYADKNKLDADAKAAGFDNWRSNLIFKQNYQLNPDCPVMTPWKTVTPINTPSWSLERNPYFWQVDTEGNQLPYIDKLQFTLAENLEVLNLRAIAGEFDEQTRALDAAKLPTFLENKDKGNYQVVIDPSADAAATALHVNQSYDADPEIAKWLTNVDFRRAISMGIDRDQINEAFFLGLGTPSSLAGPDDDPENPGPEWRTKWSTLDLKQANDLLDKIGLTKKDANGMRLRTDNGQILRIEVITVAASMLPWGQQMEMVSQHWKKIGIQLDVKDIERSLADKTTQSNGHQIRVWGGGNADIFLWSRHDMPTEPLEPFSGTLYAQWYASGGTQGKKPTDENLLKAYDILRQGAGVESDARVKLAQDLKRIIIDNQWVIGTVGFAPNIRIIKNTMENSPGRLSWISRARTPGCTQPSTYFFKS